MIGRVIKATLTAHMTLDFFAVFNIIDCYLFCFNFFILASISSQILCTLLLASGLM